MVASFTSWGLKVVDTIDTLLTTSLADSIVGALDLPRSTKRTRSSQGVFGSHAVAEVVFVKGLVTVGCSAWGARGT
jgi:hypothetical protein